jgi:hypothetical protein
MSWPEAMRPVMRSGAAAKLRMEEIRMQRMSAENLDVESLDKERLDKKSRAERELRMNAPWRRINFEGLHKHSIMLSTYLIKSCRAGLYVGFQVSKFQGFRVSRKHGATSFYFETLKL